MSLKGRLLGQGHQNLNFVEVGVGQLVVKTDFASIKSMTAACRAESSTAGDMYTTLQRMQCTEALFSTVCFSSEMFVCSLWFPEADVSWNAPINSEDCHVSLSF